MQCNALHYITLHYITYIHTHRCTCQYRSIYVSVHYVLKIFFIKLEVIPYPTLPYLIYRWIGADCCWLRSRSMTVPCSTRRLGCWNAGHLAMRCSMCFDRSWAMNCTRTFTKHFIENGLHLGSAAFLFLGLQDPENPRVDHVPVRTVGSKVARIQSSLAADWRHTGWLCD